MIDYDLYESATYIVEQPAGCSSTLESERSFFSRNETYVRKPYAVIIQRSKWMHGEAARGRYEHVTSHPLRSRTETLKFTRTLAVKRKGYRFRVKFNPRALLATREKPPWGAAKTV